MCIHTDPYTLMETDSADYWGTGRHMDRRPAPRRSFWLYRIPVIGDIIIKRDCFWRLSVIIRSTRVWPLWGKR